MAVRPGIQIIRRETPPPRSAPTDSGVWFVAGIAEKGPKGAYDVRSMADFERIFGARLTNSLLYDSMDTFFHEGGAHAIVSRVISATAAKATLALGTSLTINALSEGTWGNRLKLAVLAGVTSGYRLQVLETINAVDIVRELSPDLATQQAGVDWGKNSGYIRVVLGAGGTNPAPAAAASLAGGTDGAAIVAAEWQTALDQFTSDYGPGQVSFPGKTDSVSHGQLLQHAKDLGRTAFLDPADTVVASTLTAAATAARNTGNGRYGAMFAPWVVVPGYVAGTLRTVPPSAFVAGITARSDALFGNANIPAAGENGQAQWALDVSQLAWDGATRNTLLLASVNCIRNFHGGVLNYGWRSLVDPANDPNWVDLGNVRLYMQIAAQADLIAESYVLRQIDGQGVVIGAFGGALVGMLLPYFDAGALYGEAAEDAFRVDVGPQVNTPETISNRELRAVLTLRMSPPAELVTIEIVKVAITEVVTG
jgi:Phage tail sheath protein subtilisin-like domain